ncbi:unnamed protein product [Boreogadus saida]
MCIVAQALTVVTGRNLSAPHCALTPPSDPPLTPSPPPRHTASDRITTTPRRRSVTPPVQHSSGRGAAHLPPEQGVKWR